MLNRKLIIQKTRQVGVYTLLSRCLGLLREFLTVRYMGAGALADAFFTAWKVPNLLRKIFAEGAMSAAFVPTIMQTIRADGKKAIGGLMVLGFLVFEGLVLFICALAMMVMPYFVKLIAPGFSPEQLVACTHYLRILMPFIFLISTSALLAGPLQAINHFFVPAFGPVLLNIIYILGLFICLWYDLPITALCWFIMAGGVLQLVAHIIAYIYHQFSFQWFDSNDRTKFRWILIRFVPCLVSMSVMEAGLFIDTSFATYLSKGSVALINYANRFMGIPLGVFAVAFSTTLLPHFSRISSYAPRRLGFYLLEATKLIWWVTIPMTLAMMFFSHKFFITLFLSNKFSLAQADEAATILRVFLVGLFFFSINKILLNIYYVLHQTAIPAVIAVVAVCINVIFAWFSIDMYQAAGVAVAITIAAIIQTILLYGFLSYLLKLPLYAKDLALFIMRYSIQLLIVGLFFFTIFYGVSGKLSAYNMIFFTDKIGFWLWVSPLCALFMGTLYYTRAFFGVRVLFLEKE